jgi:hypothetical protein
MNPQVRSPSSLRQWLIAAVAVAGLAVLGFLFWKPEAPRESQAEPAPEAPAPARRLPPKFTPHPAEPTVLPPEAATPDKVAACRACEEKNRGGLCVKNMGCDGLTGEDKVLCDNLRSCLRAHPECNTTNPALCYCGEAKGLECVKTPKGPCAQEALAATKTSDLLKSAERYFRPEFPSGRATQVSACHIRACRQECVGLQL